MTKSRQFGRLIGVWQPPSPSCTLGPVPAFAPHSTSDGIEASRHVLVVDGDPVGRMVLLALLVEVTDGDTSISSAGTLESGLAQVGEDAELVLFTRGCPEVDAGTAVGIVLDRCPQATVTVVSLRSDGDVAEEHLHRGVDIERTADLLHRLARSWQRYLASGDQEPGPRLLRAVRSSGVPTVALDRSGRIIAVNEDWSRTAQRYGLDPAAVGVGTDYLAVCDAASGRDAADGHTAADGIRAVLAGEQEGFSLDYPCHGPVSQRWFTLRVVRAAGTGSVLVSHLDITDLRAAERAIQGQASKLWSLVDPGAEFVTLLDEHGAVIDGMPDHVHMLGDRRWIGENAVDVVHERDQAPVQAAFDRAVAVPGSSEEVVARVGSTDGCWRYLELVVTNLLDDPEVGGMVVSGRDVSADVRARASRLLWDELLDELPAAILVTDDAGLVVVWNDRASELFGKDRDEMLGRHVFHIAQQPEQFMTSEIREALGTRGRWSGEWDLNLERGVSGPLPAWVKLQRLEDPRTGFTGVLAVAVDRSEQRRLRETLIHREEHDPLTNLLNRLGFLRQVDERVGGLPRDAQWTLALLSLDRFREVNATRGTGVGDRTLRAVARSIELATPQEAVVGRLFGDVFAVALPYDGDAVGFGERVRAAVTAAGAAASSTELTVSVGLRMLSAADENVATALDEAREAAADVKAAGGNGVCFFEDAFRDAMLDRVALQRDLRGATARGEFVVEYQPVVRLRDGVVVGAEALVRWQHPRLGLLGPDAFIPLAESTGLIHEIGAAVISNVCRHAARWWALRPETPMHIAVNVSAAQLGDERLACQLRTELERWALPPSLVVIELTESMVMDQDRDGLPFSALEALKALGVGIAVDDFGTGYSSLARLKDLPLDVLKIDRSFVRDLSSCPEDASIVATVISLAEALGLDVVAEGVETEAHRDALARLGCPVGQGYLWSRSVPAEVMDELLSRPFPAADPEPGPTEPAIGRARSESWLGSGAADCAVAVSRSVANR